MELFVCEFADWLKDIETEAVDWLRIDFKLDAEGCSELDPGAGVDARGEVRKVPVPDLATKDEDARGLAPDCLAIHIVEAFDTRPVLLTAVLPKPFADGPGSSNTGPALAAVFALVAFDFDMKLPLLEEGAKPGAVHVVFGESARSCSALQHLEV